MRYLIILYYEFIFSPSIITKVGTIIYMRRFLFTREADYGHES